MSRLRFTLIDDQGATSFVAPGHVLKMVAAACSRGPRDAAALIEGIGRFDPGFAADLASGLLAFDERAACPEDAPPPGFDPEDPFRVVDEATRAASQQPERLGLVVVNLPARRIVQVQNSYAELRRSDRGRMRRNGRPVQMFYEYELPVEWSIVP